MGFISKLEEKITSISKNTKLRIGAISLTLILGIEACGWAVSSSFKEAYPSKVAQVQNSNLNQSEKQQKLRELEKGAKISEIYDPYSPSFWVFHSILAASCIGMATLGVKYPELLESAEPAQITYD